MLYRIVCLHCAATVLIRSRIGGAEAARLLDHLHDAHAGVTPPEWTLGFGELLGHFRLEPQAG